MLWRWSGLGKINSFSLYQSEIHNVVHFRIVSPLFTMLARCKVAKQLLQNNATHSLVARLSTVALHTKR